MAAPKIERKQHEVDICKASLIEVMLRSGGQAQIKALGTSMLPSIWPGDMLTVQSIQPQDLNPGDIVAIRHEDRWHVHRLVAIYGSLLITRGDCTPQDDPPVHCEKLLGKVVAVCRADNRSVPGRRLSWLQRTEAWLFCNCDWLRNLALNVQRKRQLCPGPEVASKLEPTAAS